MVFLGSLEGGCDHVLALFWNFFIFSINLLRWQGWLGPGDQFHFLSVPKCALLSLPFPANNFEKYWLKPVQQERGGVGGEAGSKEPDSANNLIGPVECKPREGRDHS